MSTIITDADLATIKDCMQLVQLMYEDMVKNNLHTKSRDMAGRVINSNEYDRVKEMINRKYTYHINPHNGK